MNHSTIDTSVVNADAEGCPRPGAEIAVTHRGAPLPHAFRGVRAEEIMGVLADAIDYEFLEIVFGHRGRKVPKDIGL